MIIETYLNRLALQSFRPNTILLRKRVLTNLANHLAPQTLESAGRHDLERFLARDLAPGSRRVYRSCIRHFYAWATDEGFVSANPAERIPAIRVARGTPRPLDDEALRLALSHADLRMRAWLLLMCLAGLRCMEVAALTPGDLMHQDEGVILFLREVKGGGTATVPAHALVVAALAALPISAGLWWSVRPQHVGQYIAAYLRSMGIDATAHQLRHSAATLWLRDSEHDLLTTSVLMRHKSVETTQIYAQLDPVRPAQVVSSVQIAV